MSSCRATRRHLLDVVGRTASDAVRLEVESHLENCPSCRTERARWGLLGLLKAQPTPHLSAAAERRIITRLFETPRPERAKRITAPRPGSRRIAVAFGVAILAAGAFVLSFRFGGARKDAGGFAEGQRLEETARGTISFGGARVAYEPGTTMIVHPSHRHLTLSSGQIEVDVTEGLPGRFRVATSTFIVEVLGTRFVVTPAGVHTLRGHVRVLDLNERELVALQAGESWTNPAPATEGNPTALEISSSGRVRPPLSARVALLSPDRVTSSDHAGSPSPDPSIRPTAQARVRARAAFPSPLSVTELLALTRTALAGGDATAARTWIRSVRAEHPNESETAAADLLEADAWLVAHQPDRAITAYRRVFRKRPGAPEGEMAAFAVGQLLAERDAPVEAVAALNDYLVMYPQGRFVREARERLAQLQAAQ